MQTQWGEEESRDLILIRGEVERDFIGIKRNKTVWEIVSVKMKERGYSRTSDQCKCKWKNLLNRYKGKETSDPESGRQCPFFDEIHAVFTQRAKNMQRLLSQSEKRVKRLSGSRFSDDFSDDEDDVDEEDENEEVLPARGNPKKRRTERNVSDKSLRGTASGSSSSADGRIGEMLKEFFEKQQRMEMEWREMMERRAREREMLEQEWRQKMVKHEREMLMVEQAWRDREDQRRIREERRAEKRDALLTTLLNKLINENNL